LTCGNPARRVEAAVFALHSGAARLRCLEKLAGVVMIDVLIKDQSQVLLAGVHHPVQALAAGLNDLAFSDRVRTVGNLRFGRRPRRASHRTLR
jgi:hypothetical protein